MSEKLKNAIPWAALVMAFSAGGAWAHATSSIASAQDRITTLERDKIGRADYALRDSAIVVELRALRAIADKTSTRVSAIYCADKPAGCQ